MKSSKTTRGSRALVAALLIVGCSSVSVGAFARDAQMINNALNQTLKDSETVQKSYNEHPAAARPEVAKSEGRIPVEIDGDIGGKGGRLKGFDATDRTYHERVNAAKLDREVRDADRTAERSAERSADRTAKAERYERAGRSRRDRS